MATVNPDYPVPSYKLGVVRDLTLSACPHGFAPETCWLCERAARVEANVDNVAAPRRICPHDYVAGTCFLCDGAVAVRWTHDGLKGVRDDGSTIVVARS